MPARPSQQVWKEIVTASLADGRRVSSARLEALVEERLTDVLKSDFAVEEISLSEATKRATLAKLTMAAKEMRSRPADELEMEAQRRWQEIEGILAPHSNGHATAWQRIVQVVTRHGDGGTGRRSDTATGRRGDGATRRRAGFAVACAAAIAIIVFIATHRGAPHRQPFVARRRAPVPQRKPAPQPKSATNQPTKQPTNNASPKTQNLKPKTEPPARAPEEPEYAKVEHLKVGTFVKIMGAPTITGIGKGERGSRVLKPSDGVYTAVRIVTGDADKAELQFNDGTTLALNFNTTLEIPDELLAVNGEQSAVSSQQSAGRPNVHTSTHPHAVRLLLGHLWAKVRKAPDQKFTVETPVATAAVRGTEFGLKVQRTQSADSTDSAERKRNPRESAKSADKPLEAVLSVKEGLVEFSNSLGKVEATAMTETVARPDAKPTDPKRLPSLKIFRMSSGRIYYVETTSRLTFPNAAERLAYPLGWAGLRVKDVATASDQSPVTSNQSKTQARIVRVTRGSPAERAELKVGDVVTAVNGKAIGKASEVDAAIFSQPNARVELTLLRGKEEKRVSLTTTSPPDAAPRSRLPGSEARSLDDTSRLLFQGKTDEAERALQQWLARHAIVAAAHNNLGVLCETKDDMRTALQHYQRAVQSDPQTALYHFNLGMALKNVGNFKRAQEELERATQLAPRWVAAPAELAAVYTLLNRYDDAMKAADEALRRNPQLPEAWLVKCNIQMKQRRPDEALGAALKAAELEPDYASASSILGNVHFDRIQLDETEKMVRKAIELDPTYASAYNLMGQVYSARWQLDDAEKMYRKAIALEPELGLVYSSLSGVYRARGQLNEAEKLLRKSIELDPRNPLTSKLAGVFASRSRFEDAEKLYLQATEADPNFADAYTWLGRFYLDRHQLEKAEKAFRHATNLVPDYASAYVGLGRVYQSQRKLDQAEEMYHKASELDPKDPWPCYELAGYFRGQGQLEKAKEMYRKAVELGPTDAVLLHCTAWCYLQDLRKYDEAEELLRKAIEIAPKWANPYRALGRAYQYDHKYDDALLWYRKAAAIDANLNVYVWMGEVYGHRGQLDEAEKMFREAEKMYRKAIEIDPNNAAGYLSLGEVYLDRRQWDEAQKVYRRAMELNANSFWTCHSLGRALAELHQFDEAEKMYRKSIDLDPNAANAYHYLGRVLDELRRFDEAEKMYRKAIALDPKWTLPHDGLIALFVKQGKLAEAEAALQKKWEVLGIAVKKAIKFEFDDNSHGFQPIKHIADLRVEDGLLKGTVTGVGPYMVREGVDVDGSAVKAIGFRIKVSAAGAQAQLRFYWTTLLSSEWGSEGKSIYFPILADNEFHEYLLPVGENPLWNGHRITGIRLDPTNGVQSATFEVDWIRGTNEEVSQALRKVIERDPGNAYAYMALGRAYQMQQKYDDALLWYGKAAEIDPKLAKNYMWMGEVYHALRQFDEAEKMYRKAMELLPNNADLYVELATLLRGCGQVDEAEKMYLKAVEVATPGRGAVAGSAAIFYRLRGQLEQAQAMCLKSLEMDRNYPTGQILLGRIYLERGRVDEAKKVFAKAEERWREQLRKTPDDPTACGFLGWVLSEQRARLDEAVALLQRAVNTSPTGQPYWLSILGGVHYQRGELTDAEATLKRALEIGDRNAIWEFQVWETLGRLYETKRDRQSAVNAYREALTLQADNLEAKQALERLERDK